MIPTDLNAADDSARQRQRQIEKNIVNWLRETYQDIMSEGCTRERVGHRKRCRENYEAGSPSFEGFEGIDEFLEYPTNNQDVDGDYQNVGDCLMEFIADEIRPDFPEWDVLADECMLDWYEDVRGFVSLHEKDAIVKNWWITA